MTLFAVLAHEVHSVTVFIPEGALVGEGAVCDGDVVVVVVGGEGPTLVVGHGVTWRGDRRGSDSQSSWLGKLRVTSLSPFTVLCFKEEQARGDVHHAGLSTARLKIKIKATFSAGSSVISAEPRSVKSSRLRCYLLFNDLGGQARLRRSRLHTRKHAADKQKRLVTAQSVKE